ncbi:META domain-containing protein [Niabella hibiscisoli]|uniref:META domain-containing protein n=1 Tax=Niabella hibiscisoli TaxID=1825928 RepID=UPI001F0D6007|nr:META domain-containing protein [Niabella hibiscisoli]MCH5718386.1 META domain-containing protein [Niabella hibiscisoli]
MKQPYYIILGLAFLCNACGNTKKATQSNETASTMTATSITGKKWKLIELNGQPVADRINDKEPFIEFNDTNKRYTASGGCNGLGGTYTVTDKGRITFSQGMSTMMACENMMVENQLKEVFGKADNFTVNNNVLSLNKARMAPLARFQVVDNNIASQLNGTWEVDYISGPRIAFEGLYPDKKPTITFNLPDTVATGNSSCNSFRSSIKIDGSKIRFGMPASTRMACPGAGESTFFKTLQSISQFSVSGNTLNLIMGDIAVMRLQRK